MDADIQESISALSELKTSSRSSMTMVLIGFVMLLTSFVYSVVRLSPIERQVQAKQIQLAEAADSLSDIQEQIHASQEQLTKLNQQTDDLVKTIEELQTQVTVL